MSNVFREPVLTRMTFERVNLLPDTGGFLSLLEVLRRRGRSQTEYVRETSAPLSNGGERLFGLALFDLTPERKDSGLACPERRDCVRKEVGPRHVSGDAAAQTVGRTYHVVGKRRPVIWKCRTIFRNDDVRRR